MISAYQARLIKQLLFKISNMCTCIDSSTVLFFVMTQFSVKGFTHVIKVAHNNITTRVRRILGITLETVDASLRR